MRVGPGRDYMVDWMYMKRGLPMEVIQEYDTWRKVRDAEGNEGWVLHSLLSGDRTAIVAPWEEKDTMIEMRARPVGEFAHRRKARARRDRAGSACEDGWCELEAAGRARLCGAKTGLGSLSGRKLQALTRSPLSGGCARTARARSRRPG